jgi:hypothetical protein
MVNKKRHLALKAGLVLLVVMVFFTFFSSTIHYFLTPKVTITPVRQGTVRIMPDEGQPDDEPEMLMGILVPLSAVIDGSYVYVVTQRDTFLGKQLYVHQVVVTVQGQNMAQAVISQGLRDGNHVVTSWDRPLSEGQRVVLPNECTDESKKSYSTVYCGGCIFACVGFIFYVDVGVDRIWRYCGIRFRYPVG